MGNTTEVKIKICVNGNYIPLVGIIEALIKELKSWDPGVLSRYRAHHTTDGITIIMNTKIGEAWGDYSYAKEEMSDSWSDYEVKGNNGK